MITDQRFLACYHRDKEQLAEGLHLIDFEQLKIENQSLNEKIEERNEELIKLRKKTTITVQVGQSNVDHENKMPSVANIHEQMPVWVNQLLQTLCISIQCLSQHRRCWSHALSRFTPWCKTLASLDHQPCNSPIVKTTSSAAPDET